MTDFSKKKRSKSVMVGGGRERRKKRKGRSVAGSLSYNYAIFSPETKEGDLSEVI